MSAKAQIDYDALAAQARNAKPAPKPASSSSSPMDYDALAEQARQTKPVNEGLTTNTIDPKTGQGFGLYSMTGPDGSVSDIPHNKVLAATKTGYTTTQAEREHFARNLRAEQGHALTPATDLPKASDSPSSADANSVLWNTARQKVNDWTQPKEQEKWTNFAKRVGAGLFGIADFPVAASGSLIDAVSDDPVISAAGVTKLRHMLPAEMVADRVTEFKKNWKADPNTAMNNLGADVTTFALAHKAGELAHRGMTVVSENLNLKGVPQTVAGIRPKVLKDLVKDTVAKNTVEEARASEAQHAQAGVDEGYAQTLRTKAADIQTIEATEAAKRQDTHQKAVTATEEGNEAERQRVETDTSTAQTDYFRKHAEHQQQTLAIEVENERLQSEHLKAVDDQEKLQTRLNEADRSTKVGLAALEKRLHTEASAKYEALTPKLASYEADPALIDGMLEEATAATDPAVGEPPILAKLYSLVHSDQTVPTYMILDNFRKAIDTTLRNSRVAGTTYHIYRKIMEPVIVDEMARIAENQGLSTEANEARSFFRAYAESFRDQTSPLRTILKNPEAHGVFSRMRGKQSFVARLRAFGPDGEKLATQIEGGLSDAQQSKAKFNSYGGIEVKPPTAPTLGKVKEFAEQEPKPTTPKITPAPAPPQPQLTSGSPEERAAQQVPQPDRVPGIEADLKQVSTEDLSAENAKIFQKAVESARNRAIWVFAGLPWLWIAHDLIKLDFGAAGLHTVGAVVGSTLAVAGFTVLTDLLEKPEAVKFFAEPSKAQLRALNQLTPAQRGVIADGFKNVQKSAKVKGIKVSPWIAAYVALNGTTNKTQPTPTTQGAQP